MNLPDIEHNILKMAAERGIDKTICPSEVARAMFPEDWRKHMDDVRRAALHLQQNKKVLITQKGRSITGTELKGPVRIKIIT
jgi:hypothetical protein